MKKIKKVVYFIFMSLLLGGCANKSNGTSVKVYDTTDTLSGTLTYGALYIEPQTQHMIDLFMKEHLASGYGDIPVAAYGIVKRIDQFPLNVSMGLCQGFMPFVGYNYSSGNYRRMREVSVFSWKTAIVISACFIICFVVFAPQILHLFIREIQTSELGASFLRVACLAVPLTSANFLISYTLQAMGKGIQSAVLTFSRQGLLNIPLLI